MATFQELDALKTHGNTTLASLDAVIAELEDCEVEQSRTVAFISASSNPIPKSGDPLPITLKLYTAGGQPLASDLSIDVQNAGGSAEPGVHYTLSPTTVVFPAGSADGTLKTVTLTPISGTEFNGDKTAILGLNPGKLGTINKHTVEIEDTWCHEFDFVNVSNGGWVTNGTNYGTWVLGLGWSGDIESSQSTRYLDIRREFTGANITRLEINFSKNGGAGANNVNQVMIREGSTVTNLLNISGGVGVNQTYAFDGDWHANQIRFAFNAGTSGAYITAFSVKMLGTDLNPFGIDNC